MRMKSKLALLAMSAFLSTVVTAQQEDVVEVQGNNWFSEFWDCCCNNQNFLVGLELGYGRQYVVFTTDFQAPVVPPPVNNIMHYDATLVTSGLLFGILGGWQVQLNRFMWGLEANLDTATSFNRVRNFTFQDYDVTNRHWFQGATTYKRGPILALTTRFGYFVTPGFFPYVRVGVQTSHNTVTYQTFEGDTIRFPQDFSTVPRAWDLSSAKKQVYGFVLGGGVEFPAFIGPSTIRVEYNFTQDQGITISDKVLPITGTHVFHKPQNNIIKAAWVWNFV